MNTTELDEILEERGKEYGDFGDIAMVCESVESVLISNRMTDVQKCAMRMIIHKAARIACGNPNHKDSWVDIAGFAKLAADRIKEPQSPSNVGAIKYVNPDDLHEIMLIQQANATCP